MSSNDESDIKIEITDVSSSLEKKENIVEEEAKNEVVEEEAKEESISNTLVEKIKEKLEEDNEENNVLNFEKDENNNNISAEHLNIIELGLSVLNRRYGENIKLDNNLQLQVIKESIEYIETFNRFTGKEKHVICTEIIKRFLVNRGIEWSKIDKVVNNSISFAVSISKNGVKALKLDKKVVGDVQDIFNQIYPLVLKDVEKKYPSTDEIINSLFDICLVTMKYVENYKNVNKKQKLILVKNILIKVIELLPTINKNIKEEDLTLINDSLDGTLTMVELGFDASEGQLNINAENVEKISGCLIQCFLAMFKKFKK